MRGAIRPMWGGVKEEAARDRVAFSRAAHIGSNEPPPGYPSAMAASLQCPLVFCLVSLFRVPCFSGLSSHTQNSRQG